MSILGPPLVLPVLYSVDVPKHTLALSATGITAVCVFNSRPITNQYTKKQTMTRTTGVFIMDRNQDTMSSLDAIKGQGLVTSDSGYPQGVKQLEKG